MFTDIQRLDGVLQYIASHSEEVRNQIVNDVFSEDIIRHAITLWHAADEHEQNAFIESVSSKIFRDGESSPLRGPLRHLRIALRQSQNPSLQVEQPSLIRAVGPHQDMGMNVVEPSIVQEGVEALPANLRSLFTHPEHEFNRADVASRVIGGLFGLPEQDQERFWSVLQRHVLTNNAYQARYQELLTTLTGMGFQPAAIDVSHQSHAQERVDMDIAVEPQIVD